MRHSGYQIGGCSPFGLRKPMPVYIEKTILDLKKVLINGGKRGFLLGLPPHEISRLVRPILVTVALVD